MRVTKTNASQNFGMLNIRKSVGNASYYTLNALLIAKGALNNLAVEGRFDITINGTFNPDSATSGIRIVVSDELEHPRNFWGQIKNAFKRFFLPSESDVYSGKDSDEIISLIKGLKDAFLNQKQLANESAESGLCNARNKNLKKELVLKLTTKQ